MGIIGKIFTTDSITGWYSMLAKSSLNPSSWIFGPVWAALFLLMGISLWLIWVKEDIALKAKRWAICIFIIQLVLNTAWSIIFFGLHNVSGALIDIVLMWIFILMTIILFSKISKKAAWLLVPYIAWVSFAIYLNYSIWALNS